MPSSRQSTPPSDPIPSRPAGPPPIDLELVTEATRRALYDATVAVYFRLPEEAEEWMPCYDADQARLSVFRYAGRWFATWFSLEVSQDTKLSVAAKRPLLSIYPVPGAPYGIGFQEV